MIDSDGRKSLFGCSVFSFQVRFGWTARTFLSHFDEKQFGFGPSHTLKRSIFAGGKGQVLNCTRATLLTEEELCRAPSGWILSSLTNGAGRLHGRHSVQGLLLLLSVLVSASVAAVMVVVVVSSLLTLALARPGRRVGRLGSFQVVGLQAVLVLVLLRQRGRRASDGTEVNNGLRGRQIRGEEGKRSRFGDFQPVRRSGSAGTSTTHKKTKTLRTATFHPRGSSPVTDGRNV